jgi:hypothetical protein
MTPSSRSLKPVQRVIVTGLPSYLATASSLEASSSPPMQPPRAIAPASAAKTVSLSLIPTTRIPTTPHLVR